MLSLLEKLKAYIAEHYTGAEPFEEQAVNREMAAPKPSAEPVRKMRCFHAVNPESRAGAFGSESAFGSKSNAFASESAFGCERDAFAKENASFGGQNEHACLLVKNAHFRERDEDSLLLENCANFKQVPDLDSLLHKKPLTFYDKLNSLMQAKDLDEVEVYKRVCLDRRLFSKLRRNDYKPGKHTVLALIVAMKLNMAEARELLSYAGYGLAPNDKTDIIIGFFLENEIYDIDNINDALYRYGEKCLGGISA